MSLTTQTMATASVKKILGIAHTDNVKAPGNEAFRTGFTVSGSTVFGGDVPTDPLKTTLYQTTNGVVEYVRLKMTLDPTSNGHAYIASLPTDYTTTSSNPKRGTGSFTNGARLADSAGKLQIIPAVFGTKYEAIPYNGGTSSKGSGTIIPPMDARDWSLDPFNGIIFQQGSGGSDSTIDYLECFIWIGDFVTDAITAALQSGFTDTSTFAADVGTWYTIDSYTPSNPNLSVSKWYVTTYYQESAFMTEINGLKCGSQVTHNCFGSLALGDKLIDLNIDYNAGTGKIDLLAKPLVAGVTVEIRRLMVQ